MGHPTRVYGMLGVWSCHAVPVSIAISLHAAAAILVLIASARAYLHQICTRCRQNHGGGWGPNRDLCTLILPLILAIFLFHSL